MHGSIIKNKEHIYRFIGKYEIYTIAVFRFLVAFTAFTLINPENKAIWICWKEYPIPLLFALLCSFLHTGMMLFWSSSDPVELLRIIIGIVRDRGGDFVILFCIFPFSRKRYMPGVDLSAWRGRIPYVVPVASGLLSQCTLLFL